MQRCIEERDVERFRRERQIFERACHAAKKPGFFGEEFPRRAKTVDVIVAHVESNASMAHARGTMTEPPIAGTKVKDIAAPAETIEHMPDKRVEGARADGPLAREGARTEIGQRAQRFTAVTAAFHGAMARVFGSELCSNSAHGAAASVLSK